MNLKEIKIRPVANGYITKISGEEGEFFEFIASDLEKTTKLLHGYIEEKVDTGNVIPIR